MNCLMQEQCTVGCIFFLKLYSCKDTYLVLLPLKLEQRSLYLGTDEADISQFVMMTKINVCLNKRKKLFI